MVDRFQSMVDRFIYQPLIFFYQWYAIFQFLFRVMVDNVEIQSIYLGVLYALFDSYRGTQLCCPWDREPIDTSKVSEYL